MIYQNSLSYENNRRKRLDVSVIIHFLFTNNMLQMNEPITKKQRIMCYVYVALGIIFWTTIAIIKK